MNAGEPGNASAAPHEESHPQQSNADANAARPLEAAHVEPRESVAHFEPAGPPAPTSNGQPVRPFVVWSSGPAEKAPGEDRGPQE